MDRQEECEAYLAKINKTVTEARALVDAVRLRVAETDRMLEKQGLTREQVMSMRITPEQRELVQEELKRLGLPPLEDPDELAALQDQVEASRAQILADEEPKGAAALENRTRKFGSMMQEYRL